MFDVSKVCLDFRCAEALFRAESGLFGLDLANANGGFDGLRVEGVQEVNTRGTREGFRWLWAETGRVVGIFGKLERDFVSFFVGKKGVLGISYFTIF